MIVNTDTKRTTHATAKAGASGGVALVMEPEGLSAENYHMSATDAKELAEDLLRAAGVKFKITINA